LVFYPAPIDAITSLPDHYLSPPPHRYSAPPKSGGQYYSIISLKIVLRRLRLSMPPPLTASRSTIAHNLCPIFEQSGRQSDDSTDKRAKRRSYRSAPYTSKVNNYESTSGDCSHIPSADFSPPTPIVYTPHTGLVQVYAID